MKIMIIDDNPNDRLLIRRLLKDEFKDSDVLEIKNYDEFHTCLKTADLGLVLTDYQLHWSNGLRILKEIRQVHRYTPVIMVTDTGSEEIAAEAMKNGLTDYLLKRHLKRLKSAMKDAIENARVLAERDALIEKLKASEAKYRQFFEEDIAAIAISTGEGRLVDCNPRALQVFGFTDENAARNFPLDRLYPTPEDRTRYLEKLRSGKPVVDTEIEMRRVDGKTIFVVANMFPVFDSQGNLQQIKTFLFDITERKKLEEQFAQAQKMEAIGRLAGGIAHDFNNILTVINGYSDLLLQRFKPGEQIYEEVVQIRKAGERARRLTEQLLAFSRKQVIQPRVLNLNTVLQDTEKMLRRIIGEDILLEFNLGEMLANIKIDPTQLDQVILNISVNARDAMPRGGKLIFETQMSYLDKMHAIQNEDVIEGHYVMLRISDTGIGMDKTTLRRIFEPFFTTKGVGKGTGLGLSTVYGIVKQNNGYIWVYSEPGKGTTFKIYFPAVAETISEADKSRIRHEDFSGKETILLVEDDDWLRNFAQTSLEAYGYRVVTAENGEDALNTISATNLKPDLVLTDVVMPKLDGNALVKRLRILLPEFKVLFMSGYTDDSILRYGILEQKMDFIQKPFSPRDLAQKIREILDR
ncbi:MAG: hypothetical protein Kow0037_04370 [Calditrichia bacterium]